MNNDPRVAQLIDHILQIEREHQLDRFNPDNASKKQVVKNILDKVEEVMNNENQNN